MELMQTEHLNIRRMRADDWPDLYQYLSSEESQRYQVKGAYTKKECMEAIAEMSLYNTNWSVCLKSNGMVIGFVTMDRLELVNSRTFKLCFNFDMNYLIHGFVQEANIRMLQYAFEELQAHRVIGLTCAQDILSNKEYLKLKMRKEATFQKAYTCRTTKTNKPIWWDINLFALLKEEWLRMVC